ncbi:hypothetical protein MXB_2107 [Myxobolus squamalis]|nr:hypothetical protein MXB_2107 [Myxobolus squamalis]
MDGAVIEMAEEAGKNNFFIFGIYNPNTYLRRSTELQAVIDQLRNGYFSPNQNPDDFKLLVDILLQHDRYYTLADYESYVLAQDLVSETYKNPLKWNKMCLMNIARAGKFSSDRTIKQYANEIWHATPVEFTPEADKIIA